MSTQVLIIEDDEDLRSMVQEILENEGLTVRGFHDGRSALDDMKRISLPDILIIDLKLPDMDPLQLKQEFSTLPGSEKVSLVVASGNAQVEDWAQKLGAVTVLKKPFDMEILSLTVLSIVDSRQK